MYDLDDIDFDNIEDEPAYEVWALIYTEDGDEVMKLHTFLGSYESADAALDTAKNIMTVSDIFSDAELSDIIDEAGYGGRIKIRVEKVTDSLDDLDDEVILYTQNLYY